MTSAANQTLAPRLSWAQTPARMGVVLRLPPPERPLPAPERLSAADRRRLEALRRIGRESSLARRPGCALGCARPANRDGAFGDLCAAEQFRAFLEIADRRVALYRPGAEAASPDERWLLRLLGALSEGDTEQAAALIAFRVERANRRLALARAHVVAACLQSLLGGEIRRVK